MKEYLYIFDYKLIILYILVSEFIRIYILNIIY